MAGTLRGLGRRNPSSPPDRASRLRPQGLALLSSALRRRVIPSAARSIALVLLLPCSLLAQSATTPPAPTGAAALEQALSAAGGLKALLAIQDFTATGTITYYWGGNQVQAPAKLFGRAPDQFRLDSSLPQGTRSYAVSHGAGALKDTGGNVIPIPFHNTINVGVLSFPFFPILARLNDPGVAFTDLGMGPNPSGSGQLHLIQTQKQFAAKADPAAVLSNLTTTVFYLDATTNLPVGISDSTHPVETATKNYPHWVYYGNYTSVGGVQVPMLIREAVGGQTVWELRLSSIQFNAGLTDANFTM